MKKRGNKIKTSVNKQRIWRGVVIVILLLAAVITALNTQSPYGVGIGVLIGFLVSLLSNQLKN